VLAYVEAARARGIGEIGISEHVHRFAAAASLLDHEWWRAQARADIDAYRALLAAAAEAGLPVRAGIELDWLPERSAELRELAGGHGWDYVLGSVHWLGSLGIDHPGYPVWETLDAAEAWRRYFAELAAAAESGLYDSMAHPDLAKVFGHRPALPLRERLYREAADALAAAGVCIEVSTAGLRKPAAELYPAPALLAACRRAGVPVTLGSDAHAPADVGRDYPVALAALARAGYTSYVRLRGRERLAEPLPVSPSP
jgi:histidinol-phosphatase (PHP family)